MLKNVFLFLSFVRRNDNNIKVKLNNCKRQRKVVIGSICFTLDALLLVILRLRSKETRWKLNASS